MSHDAEALDPRVLEEGLGSQLLTILEDSYGGKGAKDVRVLTDGDDIVVYFDGLELQRIEEFLIESGHADRVIEQRSHFQQAIEPTFNAAVERMTGRRVISFASVTKLDPNYAIEIFRLAPGSPVDADD
jgi:uncharacterized protein YbcI